MARPAPAPDDTTDGCSAHDGLQRLVRLLPRVMRGLRRPPAGVDPHDELRARHRAALALVAEGPVTVGCIAGALGVSLPTASGLVADLESAGFVERSPDPADRRRTLVRMVDARRSCATSWLEAVEAPILRALEQLSAEERAAFVKAMEHLDSELHR